MRTQCICIPSGVVPEGTMEGFKNEYFQLSSSDIWAIKGSLLFF